MELKRVAVERRSSMDAPGVEPNPNHTLVQRAHSTANSGMNLTAFSRVESEVVTSPPHGKLGNYVDTWLNISLF